MLLYYVSQVVHAKISVDEFLAQLVKFAMSILKYVIFLFIVLKYASSFNETEDIIHVGTHHENVDVGMWDDLDEPGAESCLWICLHKAFSIPNELKPDLHVSVRRILQNENSTNIGNVLFNVTVLNWLCPAKMMYESCAMECGRSQRRDAMKHLLKPAAILCNETTGFIQNTGCYQRAYDQNDVTCNECAKFKTQIFNYVFNSNYTSTGRNETTIHLLHRLTLISVCKYIACADQCHSTGIINSCGQEEMTLLHTFYQQLVEALKNYVLQLFREYYNEEQIMELNNSCELL